MTELVPEWLKQRFLAVKDAKLPWAEVMRLALYEPGQGYYRKGVRRIGRGGDFFTSVSVGDLYGELLAVLARKVWCSMSEPAQFTVVEQGAHDGQLAEDFLNGAGRLGTERFVQSLRLVLVEPDEGLRFAQADRLQGWGEKVQWVSDWSEVSGVGVAYANELLDAFPVHRLCMRQGEWREMWVQLMADGRLQWVEGELSTAEVEAELQVLKALSMEFVEGQHIDLNVDLRGWFEEVGRSSFEGVMLLADYGLPRQELLMSERMEGTLRRYAGHQCDGKVLDGLGQSDLTAHVDFTRVAELAVGSGWQVMEFVEQGRFLTRLAAEQMKTAGFAPSPNWVRQFQTLTHPHHLGQSFHVLALAKHAMAVEVCGVSDSGAAMRRLGLGEE